MKSFDVLDRKTAVKGKFLLEASAGTGKTFAIENIVVRLLVEADGKTQEALAIDKILAVTFTRAAARDLKKRVLHAIHRALACMKAALNNESTADQKAPPDFLQAIIEAGPEAVVKAKERLQQALFGFDHSSILTIHSFCYQSLRENSLEGDFFSEGVQEEKQISNAELVAIVRDYFRTEIRPESVSSAQLGKVLARFKGNIENLEKELLQAISKGLPIKPPRSYEKLFLAFQEAMLSLKQDRSLEGAKVLEDILSQIPFYKDFTGANEANAQFFARLFDQKSWIHAEFDKLIEDGMWMVDAFALSNKRKRGVKKLVQRPLHYPELTEIISLHLAPIVNEARSEAAIFATMAHGCQLMVDRFLQQEEKVRFEDLLQRMYQALGNPSFVEGLRQRFEAVIIDEFQDTDPLQWDIFRRLFLEKPSKDFTAILVGDPKQSIYAFRRADIYTYLSAAEQMENICSLDTNFRSQPSLVNALNRLFCEQSCPGWIPLPQLGTALPYPEVHASTLISEKTFSDNLGSVHFFMANKLKEGRKSAMGLKEVEETSFFPYIVQEIQRLNKQDGHSFDDFAILVRDRIQAKRLSQFMKKWAIPISMQHQPSLADSSALACLKEFLRAALSPHDESAVKIALGGEIIGWNAEEITSLDEMGKMEEVVGYFASFRRHLFDKGFAYCFHELLNSCWHDDRQTTAEKMLRRSNGRDFYEELCHISELLIAHQSLSNASPQGLLAYLNDFPLLEFNQDDKIKRRKDPNQEAVKILTIHTSKGLEFPIVFALGLISSQQKDNTLLIPNNKASEREYAAVMDRESEGFLAFRREADAEKMRQLYVALTRAKYRVYIPVLDAAAPASIGLASPMELFLGRLGQAKPQNEGDFYNRLLSQSEVVEEFISTCADHASITSSRLSEMAFALESNAAEAIPPLTFEAPQRLSNKQRWVQSFTTLSQQGSQDAVSIAKTVPQDYLEKIKSPQTLPANAQTGIILHKLLEMVPFSLAREAGDPAALEAWITPYIADTPYQEWSKSLATLVWNVFKAPLSSGDNAFKMEDIDSSRLFREMDFIYPCAEEAIKEGIKIAPGFMKGVIDLVFFHRGKYYIIDWKSNWLGDSLDDYRIENLEAAMQSHDYYLQGTIYAQALQRYLKIFDSREFCDIFGGVFYIFLRGINPQRSDTGICHFVPQNACLIS